MAATAGQTGYNQTLGSGDETIFAGPYSGAAPTTSIRLGVHNSSPVNVTFKIGNLHSASLTLEPGQSDVFRFDHGGINSVVANGNTGIIYWYPVSSTKE